MMAADNTPGFLLDMPCIYSALIITYKHLYTASLDSSNVLFIVMIWRTPSCSYSWQTSPSPPSTPPPPAPPAAPGCPWVI